LENVIGGEVVEKFSGGGEMESMKLGGGNMALIYNWEYNLQKK